MFSWFPGYAWMVGVCRGCGEHLGWLFVSADSRFHGLIADRLAEEESKVFVLHREKKEGLGKAYIAGFKWAIEQEFDFVFEMDADFSHPPENIPDMLDKIG